jgi:hypothetical protein
MEQRYLTVQRHVLLLLLWLRRLGLPPGALHLLLLLSSCRSREVAAHSMCCA